MDELFFRGEVILLGSNIDTDQIYPGRYLDLSIPEEVGKHCLEGLPEDIAGRSKLGAIIVAGTNFGCGSSREHAPISLMHSGISLVIASSFARIFYRNCLNLGFPLLVCEGLDKAVSDREVIKADLSLAEVTLSDGRVFKGEKLGSFALDALKAGGMRELFMRRGNG